MCRLSLSEELSSQNLQEGKQTKRIHEDEEAGTCTGQNEDRRIQAARPVEKWCRDHSITSEKQIWSKPDAGSWHSTM